MEYIAEIRYANDPGKECVFVKVAAENEREAKCKIQKYISEKLGGLRSFQLHLLEEA